MNASDPTPPSGENVTGEKDTEQSVLREVVDAHLDSVQDQLHRAQQESENVDDLAERVDRAVVELSLMQTLLEKETSGKENDG